MREEYDRAGSTNEAVVRALSHTGRLVTCAAVILAISFASRSRQPDVVVEMIATGIGVGIIVDAVVVRTLLVPALVAIMGRWTWWMPSGLTRLLRIRPADSWYPAADGEGAGRSPSRAEAGGFGDQEAAQAQRVRAARQVKQ